MYKLLFLLFILELTICQRRITNGSTVDFSANTNFMVFIVSAKAIENIPGWICGGSIIHPNLVLTAASCLHTVSKMYVIAGYRKYVRTEDLNHDVCTMHMKKKIVYYCLHSGTDSVHSEYGQLKKNKGDKHTSEEQKYKWTIFDIGIARTETPIDFYDNNYVKYCSYLPNYIRVNFHKKFESTGSDVVVYGWGHADYYRPQKDRIDLNAITLRYASSKIMSTDECKTKFKSRYIKADININYICTEGKGNLNAHGRYIANKSPTKFKCDGRRTGNNSNADAYNKTKCFTKNSNASQKSNASFENTRRNGICQNDHGNPLVRWIGGHPYAIGVASAFQVNKKMECVGPYLYSSVHCCSQFVHCMLSAQNTVHKSRRTPTYCDAPDNVRGYTIEETFVNWSDDTPAHSKAADYGLYDSKESGSNKDKQ